ncbi:hypothetical protein [Glaciibacter superstes]|uniref:hypothetical protein n=1 Tax=Glaciibacter superstes TaxID=501023 RepID=UPI0003B43053|nr:hypothetical protein [Glaciibacter superstes]
MADLVPHCDEVVRFGGLRGQVWVADDAFAWPGPEIEAMFYGDEPPHLSVAGSRDPAGYERAVGERMPATPARRR